MRDIFIKDYIRGVDNVAISVKETIDASPLKTKKSALFYLATKCLSTLFYFYYFTFSPNNM